jgi:FHS family Na+ dependent glucose MFS transporter 1
MQKEENAIITQSLIGDTKSHHYDQIWWSNIAKTVVFCYMLVLEGFVLSASGPALMILAKNTNTSVQDTGYMLNWKSIGYIITVFIAGNSIDYFSLNSPTSITLNSRNRIVLFLSGNLEKIILITGVLCMSLGMAFSPFTSSFAVLCTLNMVQGIGTACADTVSNILLLWIWGDAVNPYMLAMHACFGVGAFLCPFFMQIVQVIIRRRELTKRWPWINEVIISFPIMAVFMMTAAILVLFTPLSIKPSIITPQTPSDSNQVEHSINVEVEQPDNRSVGRKIIDYFKSIRPKQVVTGLCCGAALVFYTGNELGFSSFVSTFVQLYQKENFENTSSLLVSMFWLAYTVCRILSVPLNWILPLKEMLLSAVLLNLVAFAALTVSTHPAVIWTGTILTGCAMACQFPSVMALPSAHLRMQLSGFTTSFLVICSSLGCMLLTILIAKHLRYLMLIMLMSCVLTLGFYFILLFIVPKDKKQRSKKKQVQ